MGLQVYVAAPWVERDAARRLRDQIVARGHRVNGRWLDSDEHTISNETGAKEDIEDIRASQVMVVLNLSKSEGKAVEQGIALERYMPIIVIGDTYLNVFQHLKKQFLLVPYTDNALDVLDWVEFCL